MVKCVQMMDRLVLRKERSRLRVTMLVPVKARDPLAAVKKKLEMSFISR